jgi:hypothetical protein
MTLFVRALGWNEETRLETTEYGEYGEYYQTAPRQQRLS